MLRDRRGSPRSATPCARPAGSEGAICSTQSAGPAATWRPSTPTPRGLCGAALLYSRDTVRFSRRALAPYTESKAFTIPVTAGEVRTPDDVAATLTEIAREPRGGLIVPFDAFTVVHLPLVAEQALQHRLPSVSPYRQFAVDGGLLAYRPDLLEILRRPA